MPKSTRSKSSRSSKSTSSKRSKSKEEIDFFDPEFSIPPIAKKKSPSNAQAGIEKGEVAPLLEKSKLKMTDSEFMKKLGDIESVVTVDRPKELKKKLHRKHKKSKWRDASLQSPPFPMMRFLLGSVGDSRMGSDQASGDVETGTSARLQMWRKSHYDRREKEKDESYLVTLLEDEDEGQDGGVRKKRSKKKTVFHPKKICKCIPVRLVVMAAMIATLMVDALIGIILIKRNEKRYGSFFSYASFLFSVTTCDGFLSMIGLLGSMLRRGSLVVPWIVTRILVIPTWGIFWLIAHTPSTPFGYQLSYVLLDLFITIFVTVILDILGYMFLQELYGISDYKISLPNETPDSFHNDDSFYGKKDDNENKIKKKKDEDNRFMGGDTRQSDKTLVDNEENSVIQKKSKELTTKMESQTRYLNEDSDGSTDVRGTYKNLWKQ